MSALDTLAQAADQIIDLMTDGYARPIFRLQVDGLDITPKINNRLIALRIDNRRGLEADSVDITLSDHDGMLAIPGKGAVIQVWIGWDTSGLVYKGSYIVKEVEHSGAPDTLHIRAYSADLKTSLKQKHERSYTNTTLGTIVTMIASENGLTPAIHDDLAKNKIPHLDQNESDANLLTRLADEYDAMATVKNGKLLFMPKGQSQTASGNALPTFRIRRNTGDQHRYSYSDGGDEVSAVKAYYYDTKQAKKIDITIGDASSQNVKELRHIHRDKDSAIFAAKAKLASLKRSAAAFSYTLAYGEPQLYPEMTFLFLGLKPEIDDIYWLGTSVTDVLDSNGGYTTQLELEIFFPDADDVSELFEDNAELDKDQKKWTGVVTYYQQGDKAIPLTKGDQANPKHFFVLYTTRDAAQQRLDQEYSLLDLETGKFKSHTSPEAIPYTGVKAYYSTDRGKTRHLVTLGDQSNPWLYVILLHSKKAAEKALAREFSRLKARRDMLSHNGNDKNTVSK